MTSYCVRKKRREGEKERRERDLALHNKHNRILQKNKRE